jgi:hypothetical protein
MGAISPGKRERLQYDGDISSQICSSIRIRTKEARNNRKPSHQWQQHAQDKARPTWRVPPTCWVMDINSLAHPPSHNSGSERHGCNRGAVNSGDIWTRVLGDINWPGIPPCSGHAARERNSSTRCIVFRACRVRHHALTAVEGVEARADLPSVLGRKVDVWPCGRVEPEKAKVPTSRLNRGLALDDVSSPARVSGLGGLAKYPADLALRPSRLSLHDRQALRMVNRQVLDSRISMTATLCARAHVQSRRGVIHPADRWQSPGPDLPDR